MQYSFGERWLIQAGVAVKDLPAKMELARNRAKRYPRPFNRVYPLVLWMIDRLGAFFLMGKLSFARNLDDNDFDTFIVKLKESRWNSICLLSMLVIAPLMEVIADEIIPQQDNEHPLEKLVSSLADSSNHYDVIIIGSGAGGAPAALSLSEHGIKTALIEQGDILRMDNAPRILEKYYIGQGLTASLNGGMLLTLAGQTVGGTTSINSGTCLNPLPENLAHWDNTYGTAFSGDTLNPYLKKAAEHIGVCIPPATLLSKSAGIFDKGLKALGRKGAYILPRNAANCQGAGRCCFCCPHHAKQSTDLAFLPQAVKKGAALFANTKATGIEERNGSVYVTVKQGERVKTFSCRKLIIAAGALYTPGLLKRNHLGSNRSRVGKHLKIHPSTKVFAWFEDLQHGETGIPQGMGYHPPELPHITLEGIHTPKSLIAPILAVGGKKFNWWMQHSNNLASFGLMLKERGSGRVVEINSFPYTFYKLTRQDAQDIGAGIKLIASAFFAAGAQKMLLPLTGNGKKEFSKPEELDALKVQDFNPKSFIVSGFHPQGTAGIGRVVDTDLKLTGTRNIYVCDASVLPDSPGVNPMMTIMALSLRLADYLAKNTDKV